jgi:tripartite-type tricarboxylate transporter receptor subunit TctC
MRVFRTLCAMVPVLIGSGLASAQDVADFYRGKTVTIQVGTSAGGGYDSYARLLGRHLGKYIPGNPAIAVQNRPGGGSHIMSTYVANVAPQDGTVIGAPYSTQVLAPILEGESIKYEPKKLHYIGGADSESWICMTQKNSRLKTFDDARKYEATVAGTAPSGSASYLPIVLNNLFGTKFKVVMGYPGSREQMLAFQRAEVEGVCGMSWQSISQYAEYRAPGVTNILVEEALESNKDLKEMGVPNLSAFVTNDEQRQILEVIFSQQQFFRSYFVGPEVPADRVAALRTAFLAAMADPELLADAARANLEIKPVAGVDMQAILGKIYSTSPEILAKVQAAIRPKS